MNEDVKAEFSRLVAVFLSKHQGRVSEVEAKLKFADGTEWPNIVRAGGASAHGVGSS